MYEVVLSAFWEFLDPWDFFWNSPSHVDFAPFRVGCSQVPFRVTALKTVMKRTFVALTLITMTMSSFTHPAQPRRVFPNGLSSEQMGMKALDALKQSSPAAYTALYPSLADLQNYMDQNAGVYGDMLPEAKQDLSRQYERKLLPAIRQSFASIRAEGRHQGIRWSTAKYVRTECITAPDQTCATITIVFSNAGKEYRLQIEKALVLNGAWKLSQYAQLI
jgi:hypothetical protein